MVITRYCYGRQTLLRDGVVKGVRKGRKDGRDGVSGRSTGISGSARRINCSAVNGEPFVEGLDLTECGLPLGEENENEGM